MTSRADLRALSEKAPKGPWSGPNEDHGYDSVPWLHAYAADGLHVLNGDRPDAEKVAAMKLAIALVNDYRSGHLISTPDGKGKEPGEVVYTARFRDLDPLRFTPWLGLSPEAKDGWARIETAVLSHYAPMLAKLEADVRSYEITIKRIDEEAAKDAAKLAEVTRERDEARDALTEIRDAWTARARLSDEDGVQALKDIARGALR